MMGDEMKMMRGTPRGKHLGRIDRPMDAVAGPSSRLGGESVAKGRN
jgi:hypothetical protein